MSRVKEIAVYELLFLLPRPSTYFSVRYFRPNRPHTGVFGVGWSCAYSYWGFLLSRLRLNLELAV